MDLVISDIIMPEMAGNEFAGRLEEEYPGPPVLWNSGYPRGCTPGDALNDRLTFLQKPIPPDVLAATVCEILGQSRR